MTKLAKKKLEKLLIEAKEAHVEYEKKIGRAHKNWPAWYADYILKLIRRD